MTPTPSSTPRFRLTRRFVAPRWLTEGEGELLGYALDVMKDAFVQRLYLGHLARFPDGTPADGLAAIGRDRRVVRGINESVTSYATRLVRWLDDRKRQGNPFALMQKLSEYTGPLCSFRTVDARGNWFSRTAAGAESVILNSGNWNWDGDLSGTRWSRFWVIVYPGGLWTARPNNWGDTAGPAWGVASGTWGSTATASEVNTLRSIVADWKPAGTRCINVILALDPASFSPTSPEPNGLWENWSKNIAGVQVPARLSTARYWDGV